MRLSFSSHGPSLGIALAVALVVGPRAAGADSVKPPPVKTVAIMSDTGQALLYDMGTQGYVVVKSGDRVGAYLVAEVAADHVVVIDPTKPHARHILALKPKPITTAPPVDDGLAPVNPYAAADTVEKLSVMNPYPAPAPTPAPDPARKPPTRIEPTVIVGEPARLDAPPAAAPAPEPANPEPAKKPAPLLETRDLKRAELDAALADFDALSKEIQVELVAGGGVRVVGLARGSLLYRMGLRKDDVVRAVAGERLTSVDAAARVYARLLAVEEFTVELERGDRPVVYTYKLR